MDPLHLIADRFFDAFYQKEWLDAGDFDFSALSIEDAYQVQDLVAQKRVESGEEMVGYKVGCTSSAIRSQFGLDEPISGRLFRPRIFEEGVELDWSDFVNCAIEPEMVLKIGKDLSGENLSDGELIESIESVSPGIEIHNFHFWHSPPTLQELVCSGGIHAGLIVGREQVPAEELSLKDETFCVFKDNVPIASAKAHEIMGGVLHSLRWLVESLSLKGRALKKNSLVIPGSPTQLVAVDRDTALKITIENVGSTHAIFRRQRVN